MELHDLLLDTEFLARTGSHRAENRFEALRTLARVFTEPPDAVLQKLVDIAVEFCGADSAGISLEEPGEDGKLRFRWVAVSGSFSQYVNGTTPRFFSPCGTCLSSGRPQHYRVTKPYYDFLGVVAEPINDGMLIPWVSQENRGTIWAVSHRSPQTFTLDDYKLLSTLADFAGISVRLTEREKAHQQSRDTLESQVEQRTSSLRQLSSHLLRVQDDERRKLARELHDSIGQYLVAVKMNLSQLLGRSTGNDAQLLTDSHSLIDQCLSESRTISYLLHPPLLDENGLRSAAEWYVDGFSKRSGIELQLHIDLGLDRLPQDIELALFRALQVTLSNVHRHSGSNRADVTITANLGQAHLTVRDYGRGFNFAKLEGVREGKSGGVGLTGLRERVAALGGSFDVISADPGALVTITLPVALNSSSATGHA
jgi:signal transduction histidine kinase